MTAVIARPWFKALALLLSLIGFGVLIFYYREWLVEIFIPSFRVVVEWLEQRFNVQQFNLVQPKNELLIHLRLTSQIPVEVYGRTLPGMDVSGTTLSSHVLQHIFIFFAVLLAASLFSRPNIATLWLLGVIGLVVSLCLDIPFTLLGSIEGLLIQHLAPDQLNQHWLVRWEQFMTNGGRMATAMAISLGAVAICQKTSIAATAARV